MLRGLTGFDRRGFGKPSSGSFGGEDGGDGVEAVERKVGPGCAEKTGKTGDSPSLESLKSSTCEIGRDGVRIGWGCAITKPPLPSVVAAWVGCGSSVAANCAISV